MPKIYELSLKETKDLIIQKKISVGIVGFGYIGSCIGAVLADKGLNVVGIDTNAEIVKQIKQGNVSINEPDLKELIKKGVKTENRK